MVNINGIASWNPLTWLGEGKTPEAVKALEDFFKNKDGTFDMNKVLGIGGAGIGGLMGLLGGGSTANGPEVADVGTLTTDNLYRVLLKVGVLLILLKNKRCVSKTPWAKL